MSLLLSSLSRARQTAKSAALVLFGISAIARRQLAGQGAVLAFHGVRADGLPTGVSDESLHLSQATFRALCEHLASRYHVMPLAEMAAKLGRGESLPPQAVGLSFDDGYASNYELAFPILRELGLPATIFLATGFLDATDPLWFQQVDLALCAGAQVSGQDSLGDTLAFLKTLPDEEMRLKVGELLKKGASLPDAAPAVTRPLTWHQVREMRDSGLIDFGGHTHTHPILARCSVERQRWEIETCRDRITAELGQAPRAFACPNGGWGDSTPATLGLLAEAGFESAWTMVSGRAGMGGNPMEMPRYGAPESVWEADATVSGAFELVRKWRGGGA